VTPSRCRRDAIARRSRSRSNSPSDVDVNEIVVRPTAAEVSRRDDRAPEGLRREGELLIFERQRQHLIDRSDQVERM